MSEEKPFPLPTGVRGFVAGVGSVFRGMGRLISDPTLRKLAATPVVITAILYGFLILVAGLYADDLLQLAWAQPESGWLLYVWYGAAVVVFAVTLGLLALLFLTISGIVAGPFYEKMAISVLGTHGVTASGQSFSDGLAGAMARLFIFVVPAAFFALLAIIPYLGLVFMPFATAVGWLGLAAEVSEPTLGAVGHPLKARLLAVLAAFMPMLGVGAVVGMSLLVPLLPLVAIPSAIVGVADLYGRGEAAA